MTPVAFHRSECAAIHAALGAYVDGELREVKRRRLEAHLTSCQRCSSELARLQAVRRGIRRSLVVSLPGEDARQFWDGVERKIEAATPRPWWTLDRMHEMFWFYPGLKWASAAVLGTTVLLFAADMLRRPSFPPPTPLVQTEMTPTTVVESVEGGPNSSVVLFSTPDQQLKIIWVLEREKS